MTPRIPTSQEAGTIRLGRRASDPNDRAKSLDLLDVSLPNGRDFRRDHPVADGFPTISTSTRKGCSPAMAEAVDRISEGRCALSQPVLRSFLYTKSARVVSGEASGMSSSCPDRLDRQPVGRVELVGPTQSREESCKKLILTSVVVAVAFRSEWF